MSFLTDSFSVLSLIGGLTALGLISIVIIAVIRKDKDNSSLYTMILGFLAPTVVTLLALAQVTITGQKVERLEVKVDGRLTELLRLTEQAAQAKGELEGRDTERRDTENRKP